MKPCPGSPGPGVRALPSLRPDLPIVLVSGYAGATQTQQALAAGVSKLPSKRIQSREMAITLARVLHRNT